MYYRFLAAFTLVLMTSVPSYGEADAGLIVSAMTSVVKDRLPRIQEVVPGCRYTPKAPKGVIVASFATDTDDGFDWGVAVAEALQLKLSFAPRTLLYMPSLSWAMRAEDSFKLPQGPRDEKQALAFLRIVSGRIGIPHGLYGCIFLRQGTYRLDVRLIDAKSGSVKGETTFSGPKAELPKAVGEAARWVFTRLSVELSNSEQTFMLEQQDSFDDFKTYAQILTAIALKKEDISTLRAGLPVSTSATAAIAFLNTLPADDNMVSNDSEINRVVASFPAHIGIHSLASKRYAVGGYAADLNKKIDWIKGIILSDPNAWEEYLYLSDLLVSSSRFEEALVIASEGLQRWPENYRMWWSFSKAVHEYAWKIRGGSYYSDIPVKSREIFESLQPLADQAVDVALSLHPESSALLIHKMCTIGGYSDEFMNTFYKAAAVDPSKYEVYSYALNYSAPKWGGSLSEQLKIYQMAIKANSSPLWREHLCDQTVDVGNNFYYWIRFAIVRHRLGWIVDAFIIFLVAGLCVGAYLTTRRKRD